VRACVRACVRERKRERKREREAATGCSAVCLGKGREVRGCEASVAEEGHAGGGGGRALTTLSLYSLSLLSLSTLSLLSLSTRSHYSPSGDALASTNNPP
jgi:hypothetical protein